MEPNLLNPVSGFGRKLFPMEAHTAGEKPFAFGFLKAAFGLAGFTVEKMPFIRCLNSNIVALVRA